MNILALVNGAVVLVGVPTIVGACIYIGRELQILDSVYETMGSVKHNIHVVSSYLTRHHNKFNSSELHALSPYQLTEDGKSFIRSLGFENIFRDHKTDFFQFVDSEKPKLKYEVEDWAIKSIYALFDAEYMNFLKVFFYNSPTRNMENTAPTLGVYIRDQYLLEHPEITQ